MDNQEINFIVWQQEYSVNHRLLDAQHKKIIHLINDTYRLSRQKDYQTQMLEPIVNDIVRYTKLHFSTEERILTELGYKDLEQHSVYHRKMIKKTNELAKLLLENILSPNDVIVFLKEWWITHIQTKDRLYTALFEQ